MREVQGTRLKDSFGALKGIGLKEDESMKTSYFLFIVAQLVCIAAMADFVPSASDQEDVYVPQSQSNQSTGQSSVQNSGQSAGQSAQQQPTANKPAHLVLRRPNMLNQNTVMRTQVKPQSHSFISLLEADAGALYSSATGAVINNYPNGATGMTSMTGGASLDLFRGSFVLETGVQYRQLGYDLPQYGINLSALGNYLSVPTFLKFYVSGHAENSLWAKIGAYNSFLMSKAATSSGPFTSYTTTSIPMANFDWAPAVGIGGNIRIGQNLLLVLQGAYSLSVTPVYTYNPSLYYTTISGTAGLAYKL